MMLLRNGDEEEEQDFRNEEMGSTYSKFELRLHPGSDLGAPDTKQYDRSK